MKLVLRDTRWIQLFQTYLKTNRVEKKGFYIRNWSKKECLAYPLLLKAQQCILQTGGETLAFRLTPFYSVHRNLRLLCAPRSFPKSTRTAAICAACFEAHQDTPTTMLRHLLHLAHVHCCFFGIPRAFKHSLPYIWRHIVRVNPGCDIYIHSP